MAPFLQAKRSSIPLIRRLHNPRHADTVPTEDAGSDTDATIDTSASPSTPTAPSTTPSTATLASQPPSGKGKHHGLKRVKKLLHHGNSSKQAVETGASGPDETDVTVGVAAVSISESAATHPVAPSSSTPSASIAKYGDESVTGNTNPTTSNGAEQSEKLQQQQQQELTKRPPLPPVQQQQQKQQKHTNLLVDELHAKGEVVTNDSNNSEENERENEQEKQEQQAEGSEEKEDEELGMAYGSKTESTSSQHMIQQLANLNALMTQRSSIADSSFDFYFDGDDRAGDKGSHDEFAPGDSDSDDDGDLEVFVNPQFN